MLSLLWAACLKLLVFLIFFTIVYRNGSGANPASYPKDIGGSFHFGNATVA